MGHYSSSFEGRKIYTRYKNETLFDYFQVLAALLAVVVAEPFGYGYGRGVARHPYGGRSYVGPTVWGLGRKKRDAEADAYGYGGYGGGVALHPYGGSSYVGPTVWGLGRKKRDADAEAYGGYGFGYDALSGHSFIHRSGVGYWPGGEQRGPRGKRSAGWGYDYNALSGNSFIRRSGVGYYPGGVFSG